MQAKRLVTIALMAGGLAIFSAGCKNKNNASPGALDSSKAQPADHPKSDHPKSDHPKSDHPKSDHPNSDHPTADHPK